MRKKTVTEKKTRHGGEGIVKFARMSFNFLKPKYQCLLTGQENWSNGMLRRKRFPKTTLFRLRIETISKNRWKLWKKWSTRLFKHVDVLWCCDNENWSSLMKRGNLLPTLLQLSNRSREARCHGFGATDRAVMLKYTRERIPFNNIQCDRTQSYCLSAHVQKYIRRMKKLQLHE